MHSEKAKREDLQLTLRVQIEVSLGDPFQFAVRLRLLNRDSFPGTKGDTFHATRALRREYGKDDPVSS
jgi:hypothetical protein